MTLADDMLKQGRWI